MLQRSIRGIPCDVWVAEASDENDKQDTDTKYKTVELYFSRPDWHILVEEINSLSQLPLGMRTYIADSVKQKLKESRKKKIIRSVSFFFRKMPVNSATKLLVITMNSTQVILCGSILMSLHAWLN